MASCSVLPIIRTSQTIHRTKWTFPSQESPSRSVCSMSSRPQNGQANKSLEHNCSLARVGLLIVFRSQWFSFGVTRIAPLVPRSALRCPRTKYTPCNSMPCYKITSHVPRRSGTSVRVTPPVELVGFLHRLSLFLSSYSSRLSSASHPGNKALEPIPPSGGKAQPAAFSITIHLRAA